MVWKVATCNSRDGVGWVLKKPGPLDYDPNINPEIPFVSLVYLAAEVVPTCNTLNKTIKHVWTSWGWMILLILLL